MKKRSLLRNIIQSAAASSLVIAVVTAGAHYWASGVLEAKQNLVWAIAPVDMEDAMTSADLKLGERIYQVRNGCVECHGSDLGGAKFIDDPGMGTIYGPNISPARMSEWSDGEIARAIRHGIGKDGRSLRIMPSNEYAYLSKGDLASLIAYIRSVPAVEKSLGAFTLGPLGTLLVAFGKIPNFYPASKIDHDRAFDNKPTDEVSEEFGRYLATTSCQGCHNRRFTGGPIPGGPPDWPAAADITSQGIGKWSEEQFVKAMRTGINPAGKRIGAPMPITLTAQMSDTELKALWLYLGKQPGGEDPMMPAAH